MYVWQQQYWDKLLQMQRQHALPHALLFSGISGMGKHKLAQEFMQYLHCKNKSSDGYCGNCNSCKQFAAGYHPAHYNLVAKENAVNILVDDVRELKHWLTHVAANSNYKTVIVNSLDSINLAACNALLKFLEEPPGNVYFILLDNKQREIMPTILSRVQDFSFINLTKEEMEHFLLANCHDAVARLACYQWYELGPLELLEIDVVKVLQARERILQILIAVRSAKIDAVAAAENIVKEDVRFYFNIWASLLLDIIKISTGAQAEYLMHKDKIILLQELSASLSAEKTAQFAAVLQDYIVAWLSPNNIDKNLLLANLFLAWQEA
jgi:DNA polymerase-3 subunit delta'